MLRCTCPQCAFPSRGYTYESFNYMSESRFESLLLVYHEAIKRNINSSDKILMERNLFKYVKFNLVIINARLYTGWKE